MDKILYTNLITSISKSIKLSLNEKFIDDDLFGDDFNISNLIVDYVDLGLPSGTLWCKYNVGAKNETDYGNYYQWGETNNIIDLMEDSEEYAKYNTKDKLMKLSLKDDIAYQASNRLYRMPTKKQCVELVNNTNYEFVKNFNGSGVNGLLFNSKVNSNYIFIPAAGIRVFEWDSYVTHKKGVISSVWSSSRFLKNENDKAWALSNLDCVDPIPMNRNESRPVRGVVVE